MPETVDRIILVYDADSGIVALLQDIVKKAVGREDCALCAITYSPLGKRAAWSQCEARLDLNVDELHRDQVPDAWALSPTELPCILARRGEQVPFVLIRRPEIERCHGSIDQLGARIRAALDAAPS